MEKQDAQNGAWGLVAVLTVINILNFVDRQLLASFANFIKPDLGLTDFQFGLLTGLFFLIFSAVAGLFMGMLADRMSRAKLVAVAIALWSVLTAASGAAKGFFSMALPRTLIGIGESTLAPSATSLLTDRFPRDRLGLAIGLYYMGVPIGAGASLLIAGFLGPNIGWRNCFYVLGGVGLFFAIAMLWVKDDRKVELTAASSHGFLVQFKEIWPALRRSPALLATIAGGVSVHFGVAAGQFDQLWFVQERGFDKAEIAQIAGLLTVGGGVAGNIFGGFVGDWWQKKFGTGRPMMLFWMLLAFAPFNLAYRLAGPGSPFIFLGVAVGVFQLAAFYGPTFSTVQELAPDNARATVTAFYILCLNVIGLGIGITLTGLMVDLLRKSGNAEPYTSAMLIMTAASFLALPSFWLAGRWFARDKQRIVGAA